MTISDWLCYTRASAPSLFKWRRRQASPNLAFGKAVSLARALAATLKYLQMEGRWRATERMKVMKKWWSTSVCNRRDRPSGQDSSRRGKTFKRSRYLPWNWKSQTKAFRRSGTKMQTVITTYWVALLARGQRRSRIKMSPSRCLSAKKSTFSKERLTGFGSIWVASAATKIKIY